MRIPLLVVALAACGPAAAPRPVESNVARTPVAAPPPAAAPAPCPAAATLEPLLAAAWKPPADQKVVLADCVPGHFPAAGWWVLTYVDAGPADAREADLRGAIVSASNDQVLADAVIDHLAPWARADGWHGKASLADLDGDGIDEVMVESSLSHGGTDDTSLRILRLDGARLAAALDLQTRYSDAMARDDEDAATECDAKVDVGPRDAAGKRHLIVTATVDAGPKADPATVEDCVPAGRSDYVLVGDRLEKQ